MVCKEKNSNKPLSQKVSLRNFETFHDVELFVIKGIINGHEVIILVDNGFSHNFVSEEFAKKAELKTQESLYSYDVELTVGMEHKHGKNLLLKYQSIYRNMMIILILIS